MSGDMEVCGAGGSNDLRKRENAAIGSAEDRIMRIWNHPEYQENLRKLQILEKDRIFCRHTPEHFLDVARICMLYACEEGFFRGAGVPGERSRTRGNDLAGEGRQEDDSRGMDRQKLNSVEICSQGMDWQRSDSVGMHSTGTDQQGPDSDDRDSHGMILQKTAEYNSGFQVWREIIYAAALLHDIGRARQYEDGTPHDRASAELAERILPECGFDVEESGEILRLILNHRSAAAPKSFAEGAGLPGESGLPRGRFSERTDEEELSGEPASKQLLSSGESVPGQNSLGEPTPGRISPGEPTPGRISPGEPSPEQISPGEPSPGRILAELFRRADKKSRNCFLCPAEKECNWSAEKKNMRITV